MASDAINVHGTSRG